MTGSLVKRSEGTWAIVLYLGRDPVTGKKKQKWHSFQGNKKAAEKEMNRLIHEMLTGTYVAPANITVGEYLNRWLADYASVKVSGKTFERYTGIVRDHLIPALGAIQLTRLQPLQIQSHYSCALESGRKDGRDGGLSAQTVLHHHRLLFQALKQAVRWQLVGRNVCEAVDPPRPEKTEMKAYGEERTAWLLDAAENTRLQIPILLAITTGLRRGEILGLKWPDFDLDLAMFSVRRSLQETKARGLFFKETKSRKGRRLTLPEITVEMLREHQRKQLEMARQLGSDYQNGDLVCCRDDGSAWPPSAFTSAYRDLLRRRGIENIRFHDLRHSHASQLLRAGIHPKVISERLGHSKVGFTMDVYSHLLPGMQEEAAQKTNTALKAAIEKQRRPLA